MSRLYNILSELCTVEDITPSSVSSFMTVNSGYTITGLSVKKCGKLCSVYFGMSRNAATAAGETMQPGTIKSEFRPAVLSGGASATFRELVGTDGRIYARPATAVSAGSAESFAIMYLLP